MDTNDTLHRVDVHIKGGGTHRVTVLAADDIDAMLAAAQMVAATTGTPVATDLVL
jgi:hypothetical protein